MIETKNKSREQIVKEVFEGFKNNCEFFKLQSRDTLQVIIQTMKGEEIFEDDEKKKNEFLKMAELA